MVFEAAAPERTSASGWGLFAGVSAFLLPVAFSPASTAPAWLPKTAVLLLLVPVAVVAVLFHLREPLARAAATFILVACGAALASSAPVLSFVGPYGSGTSVLLLAALVAFSVVGRLAATSTASQQLLGRAFLAAASLSAMLAVLQARLDLSSYGLAIVESRSAALLGNPVHLATLLAGAIPLVWSRVRDSGGRSATALIAVLLSAGAQVSGSRFLLLGLLVAVVAIVARYHNRSAVVFAAAIVLGAVAGGVIGQRPEFAGASDRIAEVGVAEGSTMQRVYTWEEALATVRERPVVGFGPGRYLQATTRHRSEALAAAGPDSYFADAHNVFVDVAVSTGIVGLVVFLGWLFLAIRGSRGPFLWSGLALLAMHLVEPSHPGTTPLMGLMLGSASSVWTPSAARAIRVVATAAAGLLGTAAGVVVLVGDLRLQEARLDGDAGGAAAAAAQLPPWPEVSDAVARLVIFDAIVQRDDRQWDEAVEWERRAVHADVSDPRWWMLAGLVEVKAGQTKAAEVSFRTALELNEYSCGAWEGLRRLHVPAPKGVGAARVCSGD